MKDLEEQMANAFPDKDFTLSEAVQHLAIMCATGIAAMGKSHKGILINSDEFEVLITIKAKDENNE